jgi:hypothetical protein
MNLKVFKEGIGDLSLRAVGEISDMIRYLHSLKSDIEKISGKSEDGVEPSKDIPKTSEKLVKKFEQIIIDAYFYLRCVDVRLRYMLGTVITDLNYLVNHPEEAYKEYPEEEEDEEEF